MKKRLIICIVLLSLFAMGATLTTQTAGYELLVLSAAGGETDLVAATGFTIGIPDPGTIALQPKDLMKRNGSSTVNAVEIITYATGNAAATYTVALYGISVGGPPELIGSFAYTLGDAVVSSGVKWADTCVVTDTHSTVIVVADSGNDRVVKVTFDVIGYRFLYPIVHTASGATNINVLYRPW